MAKALLPHDDELRLRAFQRQVGRLRQTKIVQQQRVQIAHTTNVNFTSGEVTTTVRGYDEADFQAAMPLLRQFLLQQEDVNVRRIHNIVNQFCDRPELLGWTRLALARWNDRLAALPEAVHAHFHGIRTSVDEAIERIFYGYGGLFHVNIHEPEENKSVQAIQHGLFQHAFPHLWWCLNALLSVIYWWLDAPTDTVSPLPDLPTATKHP